MIATPMIAHPKYGTDPRSAASGASLIDDSREWPLGKPGQVNSLWGGTDHLQAVLDDAEQRNGLVVIKFKREGCAACKSTVELLKNAAASYANKISFWEVDYHGSKSFCQRAQIKVVPCVHIYGADTLLHVAGLSKSKWSAFSDHLQELVDGGATIDADRLSDESAAAATELERRLEEAISRSKLF